MEEKLVTGSGARQDLEGRPLSLTLGSCREWDQIG